MNNERQLLDIIKKYDSIVVFGHILPDPDAYGCQVALKEIIKENFPNKKVYIVGSGVQTLLPLLGPMDQIDDEVYKNSLAILVDGSALCRAEDKKIYLCKYFIKFDHHKHNEEEPFEFPYLVDEDRIACAEIIADFAIKMKLKINKIAAGALYCGLLADSGNFKYYGTTKHTLDVSKFLLSIIPNQKELFDAVFYVDEQSKKIREYLGKRVIIDGQVAYYFLTKKEYDDLGVSYEKASASVNAIGANSDENIFMLITETPDGRNRVEMRSNKMFILNGVAMQFGGGGHKFAAGCEIDNTPERRAELLKALNLLKRSI